MDFYQTWYVNGIANGQILPVFTVLSAHCASVFLFPDDNLSKIEWILTKFGMCVDIVEIWFWDC